MSETRPERPAACYRTDDGRMQRDQHTATCADGTCRGCRPCGERWHCTARTGCNWHVNVGHLTCGRCLAGVRRILRDLADLATLAGVQALGDGVNSEAANLAGPACDPEAWTWRKVAAMQGRAWHVSLIEDDDERHPARVLTTWEAMIREDYDHPKPEHEVYTISSAATYLDRMLARIAQDDEQDFPELRKELRKSGQHLEAVLHNDTRPVTGIVCPECGAARLVRHYAHWCDDPDCRRLHVADESRDEWICRADRKHRWSAKRYDEYLIERKTGRIGA